MSKHHKTEQMAGGLAHFSDISGKVEMVGFERGVKPLPNSVRGEYRMEEQIDGSWAIWPNTKQGFEDALFYRGQIAEFPSNKKENALRLLNILNSIRRESAPLKGSGGVSFL